MKNRFRVYAFKDERIDKKAYYPNRSLAISKAREYKKTHKKVEISQKINGAWKTTKKL